MFDNILVDTIYNNNDKFILVIHSNSLKSENLITLHGVIYYIIQKNNA